MISGGQVTAACLLQEIPAAGGQDWIAPFNSTIEQGEGAARLRCQGR